MSATWGHACSNPCGECLAVEVRQLRAEIDRLGTRVEVAEADADRLYQAVGGRWDEALGISGVCRLHAAAVAARSAA